jgi:CRP-like cAMP-binding protein
LTKTKPARSRNRLIAALPARDRTQLLASCEVVDLSVTDVVFEPGAVMRHAYFPLTGFVSVMATIDRTMRLEVAQVGNEGMIGAHLALGFAATPLQSLVRGGGASLRTEAAAFRRELARSAALKDLVDRYVGMRLLQLAQTIGCTRFHVVEARLARLLLTTCDRAHSNTFHVTHETLADMLGVRRAGVTNAATALQKAGLIRYRRGAVEIIDRPGLTDASCACYRIERDAYRRILG